jgi:hypothetical protein
MATSSKKEILGLLCTGDKWYLTRTLWVETTRKLYLDSPEVMEYVRSKEKAEGMITSGRGSKEFYRREVEKIDRRIKQMLEEGESDYDVIKTEEYLCEVEDEMFEYLPEIVDNVYIGITKKERTTAYVFSSRRKIGIEDLQDCSVSTALREAIEENDRKHNEELERKERLAKESKEAVKLETFPLPTDGRSYGQAMKDFLDDDDNYERMLTQLLMKKYGNSPSTGDKEHEAVPCTSISEAKESGNQPSSSSSEDCNDNYWKESLASMSCVTEKGRYPGSVPRRHCDRTIYDSESEESDVVEESPFDDSFDDSYISGSTSSSSSSDEVDELAAERESIISLVDFYRSLQRGHNTIGYLRKLTGLSLPCLCKYCKSDRMRKLCEEAEMISSGKAEMVQEVYFDDDEVLFGGFAGREKGTDRSQVLGLVIADADSLSQTLHDLSLVDAKFMRSIYSYSEALSSLLSRESWPEIKAYLMTFSTDPLIAVELSFKHIIDMANVLPLATMHGPSESFASKGMSILSKVKDPGKASQ